MYYYRSGKTPRENEKVVPKTLVSFGGHHYYLLVGKGRPTSGEVPVEHCVLSQYFEDDE